MNKDRKPQEDKMKIPRKHSEYNGDWEINDKNQAANPGNAQENKRPKFT